MSFGTINLSGNSVINLGSDQTKSAYAGNIGYQISTVFFFDPHSGYLYATCHILEHHSVLQAGSKALLSDSDLLVTCYALDLPVALHVGSQGTSLLHSWGAC